jgi:NTP pyrophosphatase (non-canonical NTP hydrolase)
MENEIITIENYQKHAMKTCLPSAKNWEYATHNYRAELFELLAKVESFHAKQIRDGDDFDETKYLNKIADEIGDCYWQLALICELRKEQFEWNYNDKIHSDLYDWVISMDFNSCVSDVWREFGRIDFIVRMFGFDINEILQRNIDKLASRAERGVLKGSGDNR